MKNKQYTTHLISLSVLAGMLLFAASCKKDENKSTNTPTPGCRIIQLRTPGSPNVAIDYNTKGQINTISDGNYIKSFSYDGNNWTITKAVAGNLMERIVVKNNSEGLAYDVRVQHDASGGNWTQYYYDYNGAQVIRETTEDNNGNKDTAWFDWKDNNLFHTYTRADTLEYTYYNDQNYRMGDAWKAAQWFEDGFEIIRNKNLVKSVRYGNQFTHYTYAYDAANVIISSTKVDPVSTHTTSYTWKCD